MHRSFQRLRLVISAPRLLPHICLLLASDNREIIQDDIDYWSETLCLKDPRHDSHRIRLFLLLMTFQPEFRNLFYLRTGKAAWPFRWMCPPLSSLKIDVPHIGPRLFIQHGDSTFISAESIGANCWIGRHIVIGYSNATDCPTIGNNVRIFPGARIIGKVYVGDNSTIGLNTVVLDNVPPGVTLLGVPGRSLGSFQRPPGRRDTALPPIDRTQAANRCADAEPVTGSPLSPAVNSPPSSTLGPS